LAGKPVSRLKNTSNRHTGTPAHRHTKLAFTLIEVLVAMLILSVGMISVIRSYITLMNAVETADFTSAAAYLLKEKMADIEKEEIETPGVSAGTKSGVFEGESAGFKWETEIVDVKIESVKKSKEGKTGENKGGTDKGMSFRSDTGSADGTAGGTTDGTAEKEPDKILKKIRVSITENKIGPTRSLSLWTYMNDHSKAIQ
ncbi:MAG: prepilin-type N-terminal cleavage/methylation domain-containing protein, partial [Candidatus Omnitrophota bacterium]|nr:prepilin-type N-terminal cleavage/methylation domain-containing protein [Candidatus Omnitrophota bacterium]